MTHKKDEELKIKSEENSKLEEKVEKMMNDRSAITSKYLNERKMVADLKAQSEQIIAENITLQA